MTQGPDNSLTSSLSGTPKPLPPRLSGELAALRDMAELRPLTIGDFLAVLNTRGHAFLCLVIGFPFLTPVPLPGVSVPFGLLILIAGISMAAGVAPWIPGWLARKKIPQEIMVKALGITLKVLQKVEFLVKPRGAVFLQLPGLNRLSGLAMAFCGGLLALPLPPGTNFPPALGIVLVALGCLERDSLLLGLGYMVTMLNAAMFGFVAFFGFESVTRLWHN
ncbi:MAG: hypothetical protein RIQ81_1547 [Pseudomonadota bacterium]